MLGLLFPLRNVAMLAASLALQIGGKPAPPSALADRSSTGSMVEFGEQVARATVLVENRSCAGFVAGARYQVVTAAHCVPYPATSVTVETREGRRYRARLDRIDRDTDLALLHLAVALPVTPLALSKRDPERGESLLFVGRADRGGPPQLARVERLGRCPSLPKIDDAVFTTLEARPGDSGSPLVDADFRVVALVHGGARCHIAAPVAPLARQLENEQPAIVAGDSRRVSPPSRMAAESVQVSNIFGTCQR